MISVIIPLYNKARTIAKTLDSVFNQTYQQFEVIIVDDGSTDDSVNIVEQLVKEKLNVRIVKQENRGVSAARNKGVEYANYNHLAFLDGDDEWQPTYIQYMVQAITTYPSAGMYCCAGIMKFYEATDGIERIASKYVGKISEIDYFENPHVYTHTSAIIVKREAFFKAGKFIEGISNNEDFALFYTIALLYKVTYVGYLLTFYNGGVEGQLTNNTSSIKKMEGVITRYNYTFQQWEKSALRKKSFIVFLKYEFRHQIICELRNNNYPMLMKFLNELDSDILKLFWAYELFLYRTPKFKLVAKTWIYLTKLRWRLYGFPVTK